MSYNPEINYTLKNINRQICCIKNSIGGPISFQPTAQDAFGRLRVSEPYTLFDSSHRYSDNGLWATATASGGTATFNSDQGLVDLTVTSTVGSSVIRETYKVFAYQPGKSLLILNTFVFSSDLSLRQRVGYYKRDENGYCFELTSDGFGFIEFDNIGGAPSSTGVGQYDWNGDKLDGTGPSGITLDPFKAQILWIDMEWLGVGSVRMGFVIDGQFILCHTFHHANILQSTYIRTACLPITYEIERADDATDPAILKQICSSVISEGGYELRGTQNTVGLPVNAPRTLATANVYEPIVALRLKSTKLDSIVIVTAISLLGLGNGKNYSWRIVQGGTVTAGTWTTTGTDSSVEYNITGTGSSGGRVLASGYLNSSNQASPVVNILKGSLFSAQLERNGISGVALEIILEVAIGDAAGTQGVLASMDWDEITR